MLGILNEKPSRLLIPMLLAASIMVALGLTFAIIAVYRTSSDADTVNQAGMIRGGIQRAVKLELAGIDASTDIGIIRAQLGDIRTALGTDIENDYEKMMEILARLEIALGEPQGDHRTEGVINISEEAWLQSNTFMEAGVKEISSRRGLFLWALGSMSLGFIFAVMAGFVSKYWVADKVEVEASFDNMTGGLRKYRFMERIENMLETLGRGEFLGLVIMDLDHFKNINDRFGHAAGDLVLEKVAATIRSLLRPGDVFGRLGGEEFAVGIRSKDSRVARFFADRARGAVSAIRFEGIPPITISAGSVIVGKQENTQDALKRADTYLYAAKAAGRNRVRGD